VVLRLPPQIQTRMCSIFFRIAEMLQCATDCCSSVACLAASVSGERSGQALNEASLAE
jgi:hypothetical protein